MRNSKERSANSVSSSQNTSSRVFSLLFSILPPLLLLYFLFTPFPNADAPRFALLLQPLVDAEFVQVIWFGENLPDAPITGERLVATALGFFVVFSAFCLGSLQSRSFSYHLASFPSEKIFFSTTLGLIFFSIAALCLGLLGVANLPFITSFACVAIVVFFVVGTRKKSAIFKKAQAEPRNRIDRGRFFLSACQILLVILFASFYVLGASTPLFEYDAVEYHAQSAREIFESGKIAFFDRNVYANMPLGAETFYLLGFNLVRDLGFEAADVLRIGSLVGKTILASFALLTALGIWAFGKRFFARDDAGLWGAILFLSFPGVFEVYSNGLNDGVLGAALFASCYLFFLGVAEKERLFHKRRALCFWTSGLGVLAGFACAVKLTGVVFVLLPLSLGLCAILFSRANVPSGDVSNDDKTPKVEPTAFSARTRVLALVLFFASSFVVCGGWLLREAVATGNPVYPLAYSVFGDKTEQWNDSLNERWTRAHSSSDYSFKGLGDACFASFQNDASTSPFFLWFLFFGAAFFLRLAFAPKLSDASRRRAISLDREKNATFGLFVLVALFWLAWFLLTHRLVRFLVPTTPLVAATLGLFVARGVSERSRASRVVCLFSVLFGLLFSGLLIDLLGVGRMAPLRALERDTLRFPQAAVYFNERPELFESSDDSDERQKLLLVGEAKAFDYRVPILYSTCWNESPLIPLLEGGVERNAEGQIVRISNAAQIVANFKEARVAYVLVDFSELERFRSPGNYGFNDDEITASLFELLVESGALVPFTPKELQNVGDKVKIYQVCSQSR